MKRTAPRALILPALFAALSLAPSAHAQSAVDERAIIAAASALDAAIDDKDWARVRELLLDEVTVALPEEDPATVTADALVARWQETLHAAKTTFHLRGSERVTFDGADSAVLRSKAHVVTRVDGIPGDDRHELWADYHHELDRTENGWQVRHYGLVPRLESGNVGVILHRLAAKPEAEGGSESDTEDDAGISATATEADPTPTDGDPAADDAEAMTAGEADAASGGDAPETAAGD